MEPCKVFQLVLSIKCKLMSCKTTLDKLTFSMWTKKIFLTIGEISSFVLHRWKKCTQVWNYIKEYIRTEFTKHIFYCNILNIHGVILITLEFFCTLKRSQRKITNLFSTCHTVCSIMIQTQGNFIRPLPFRLTQLAANSDERKIFKERL